MSGFESFRGKPAPQLGDRVRVYLNWNKGGSWYSIVNLSTDGLVCGYCEKVTLMDAKFVVRPGSLKRIVAREEKEICAFVTGTLVGLNEECPAVSEAVFFDPFKTETFVLESDTGTAVSEAGIAQCERRRVWI